jgi:hypothetical protein
MIVPAGQHAVSHKYAGINVVDGEDEKPMVMADYFLPGTNNAFESAMLPPSPASSPRSVLRGRRSFDHLRSAPAQGIFLGEKNEKHENCVSRTGPVFPLTGPNFRPF